MKSLSKLHNQSLYFPDDKEITNLQLECAEKLYDFNFTRPSEIAKRQALLKTIFKTIGNDCYIEPPLRANWGCHTSLGNNFYANFNLTLVDDTYINIGDNVMIGPNVTIATASHPIDPELRKQTLQFNLPVNIGNNVWIGANSVILPGINIGENTVIGAGSIVTKNIPNNVVAVGNPCRVLRQITQQDKEYYYQKLKVNNCNLA